MTLKNNRASHLYYVKLCLSFQSHWRIQTWVSTRKCSIRVKISYFLSRVTLKFDGWPWKTIGHLSMLHQALCHIPKPLVNSNWSYSPETLSSGQNRQFLVPCDLEISCMTLKNNRAPVLCSFKLYGSFQNHPCIQTGVTVRKCLVWV